MAKPKATEESKDSAKKLDVDNNNNDIIKQLDAIHNTIVRIYGYTEEMIQTAKEKLELQSMQLRKEVQQIRDDLAAMDDSLRALIQKDQTARDKDFLTEQEITYEQRVARERMASLFAQ